MKSVYWKVQIVAEITGAVAESGLSGLSIIRRGAVLALCCAVSLATRANSGEPSRPQAFSVNDDIAVAEFTDPLFGLANIRWSPDGRYFAVVTQRGNLEKDEIESELRIFSGEVIRQTLKASLPSATTDNVQGQVLARMSARAGRSVLSDVRWMADSSGLTFLANTLDGRRALFKCDLSSKGVTPVSGVNQIVTGYDINNGYIIYSAVDAANSNIEQASHSVTTVVTEKSLPQMIASVRDPMEHPGLSELWVVDGAVRKMVKDAQGRPVRLPGGSGGAPPFRIAPNGESVVAQLVVPTVPQSWEHYRPSSELPARRIIAKNQDQDVMDIDDLREAVRKFVVIDIATGGEKPVPIGPIGWQHAYYSAIPDAGWSSDSKHLLLTNTFLQLSPGPQTSEPNSQAPCIASVDIEREEASCVLQLPQSSAELFARGMGQYAASRYVSERSDEVLIDETPYGWGTLNTIAIKRNGMGGWRREQRQVSPSGNSTLKVHIKQGLNDRPVLIAEDKSSHTVKTIFDPNSQLENIKLGTASTFKWSDALGRSWVGGLVMPPDYVEGKRYPLVIQTHGFLSDRFLTYGAFTTGMAARELAASGLVVLQLGDPADPTVKHKYVSTPEEGVMYLTGYEGAIDVLAKEGVIDPEKVGLVGFSRTVFHVMNALTTSQIRFGAASIVDGIQFGYMQALESPSASDILSVEGETVIGAPPFGAGLKLWLQRSPEFNLDKVRTPLRIEAFGLSGLIDMWEPYAGLHYLQSPVDLVMVNTSEHVITNPSVRLSSQGGMVDWMRFWLQGYEDPAPEKAAQYKRWEGLRSLQGAQAVAVQPAR